MSARPDRFFFLHVMRTGGTTFAWYLIANFGPDRVYPTPQDRPADHVSVTSVEYLRSVPRQRWAELPVVSAHLPYFVLDLLPPYRYEKITILREPVERTLSFLRQWTRAPGEWFGATIEDLYDDPRIVPHYRNHMCKMFGLTADSGAPSYAIDVDVDEAFLARAKANLDTMDLVGFTDRHDQFIDEVQRRYGFRRPSLPDQHVTEDTDVSERLLRRIEQDNAADIDFYRYARQQRV